jgi:hypothetical protein
MAATVLAAIVLALAILPGESKASRMYAAAAAQLRTARSLDYTIVLAPFTEVEISYQAPASRRVNCSWGIEVRGDSSGRELVLFHGSRQYLMEEGKQANSTAGPADLVEQLRALPKTADSALGERQAGGKRLIGYRVNHTPFDSAIPGLTAIELWVDLKTGRPEHVDITIQEEGKPPHRMQIKDIRTDEALDPAQFDMTPPAGYTAFAIPASAKPRVHASAQAGGQPIDLKPQIRQTGALTAVVMPMKGSYLQASSAVAAVAAQLKARGITPAGPAFGRFGSEQDWDAGYPVAPGTRVEPPFQVVTLPAALTAAVVVKGAWGENSIARWGSFLKSVIEQGYLPAGPAMEMWSGEEGSPATQSTEMRMPVTKPK